MQIKELDNSAAGIDPRRLVELGRGESPEHREKSRGVGGVMIVEETPTG